ncbi:WD domain containing protein [Ophiocordyceps camponoti-floridani]|uniref:WD domain containing protein n=1 Tax=Ophiocordyceps camponoti-floridani TaxID=2030778 RepID=A0A8H4Q4U4_9HYPO|nr:WD domain containing protein [Ophiocordyceps camponoti-floridani]
MSGATAYTPLESLFLFQSLLGHGIDAAAFVRISHLLRNNALIKSGETYDPSRLAPEPLQQLFLLLLREELRSESEGQDASPSSSPSRKRKLGSPPLPSLKDAHEHIGKLPALIDRLYARYRDNIVEQIREDEQRFATIQGEIQVLEKAEKERLAKAASQHGASALVPRDGRSSASSHAHSQSPVPIPKPAVAGVKRSSGLSTPPAHAAGKPSPTSSVVHHQPAVVPPSHLPSGSPLARPASAALKPVNGSGSVLQPPAGLPQAASRVLQPPIPPPKPVMPPRQESAGKPKDGSSSATPPTAAAMTPPGGILKWEKPYQPPLPGQQTPPPSSTAQLQQSAPPHLPASSKPTAAGTTPQQPRQPTTKTAVPPPQLPGPLAAPLQPAGTPRPAVGQPPPQARSQLITPVLPPGRGIPPPQVQLPTPRPLVSALPAQTPTPKGTAGAIAASSKRNPAQANVAPQAQRALASGSASTLAPPKEKLQAVHYTTPQASRPAVPEHIIRQAAAAAAATTPAAVRVSPVTAPRTPVIITPVTVTRGFGTKWASQSTPSTPGPQSAEQESPAYEPVSPPHQAASIISDTPKTAKRVKQPKARTQHQQEPPATRPRGRPPRNPPTSSASSNRRSQSVTSQADELSMDHPMLPAKIKKEAQTPRTHDDAGDTTADESGYGRTHMTTPGSVSSRMAKRKRQETPPPEFPGRPTQVLWTRGFTKVSSSALDQISSHRDANMFATGVRERDAPNYRQIVLQPQDITSIRSAIKQGNKAAVQAAASLPGGDPGTASVWLPASEDLVPPRGIINSAQLERELVHIFCNAIMYNPDPDRGPGPAFMKRSRDEEEEAFGYHVDENGVVKNTRSMFVEVEKLLGDLRSAEKERGVPPLSSSSLMAARQASVATPADDTAEDEDELAGDGTTAPGVVKRRRVGGRG